MLLGKLLKRLQLLKVLRSYGAPEKDLMAFYTSVIRSVIEYGAQVWHGSLTGEHCYDIGAALKPWRVREKLNA